MQVNQGTEAETMRTFDPNAAVSDDARAIPVAPFR